MNISKKAMLAGGVIVVLLIAVVVLLTLLLSGRDNAAVIVPGSASPVASVSTLPSASASVGPTVLVDDAFTAANIAESSLAWNLSGDSFDNQGHLYLVGSKHGYSAYRALDNNDRLFDQDNWDLSVSMTPVMDYKFGDPFYRFVSLSSSSSTSEGRDLSQGPTHSTDPGYNSIGIGTCGGRFCLLVPRAKDGDQMTRVLGENYLVGSTYHLSMRVIPDPAVADRYLVSYRIADVARDTEIELLKGQLSIEQPFGFQTSARYDQLALLSYDWADTKFNQITLSRE